MTDEYTTPMCWQTWNAGNDSNGNPRRVDVVYSQVGNVIDSYDQGYAGTPRWLRDLPQLPTVYCKVGEYRDFVKAGAELSS